MDLKAFLRKVRNLFAFDGFLGYYLRKVLENISDENSRSSIKELAEWLDLPIVALRIWRTTIPKEYNYKHFKVLKKNSRGYRNICAPNSRLKNLQRSIYHKLLKPLRVHKSATAYTPEKSILENALPHVKKDIIINIDLKDFFGSISSSKVYRYWRFLGWDVETSTILSHICCYQRKLPQGAPTSPALSNLCNQLLDSRLAALALRNKGNYTRYSDDITFSFPDNYFNQKGILEKISWILSSEGYEIQKKKKIRIQRSHQRQTATGLIVNEKINLPREIRKRIRAMRHHASNGILSEKDSLRLAGYENLLRMINKANAMHRLPKRVEFNHLISASRILDDYKRSFKLEIILFLAASPKDQERLEIGREIYEIEEGLRRSNFRDQFKLVPKWIFRVDDLRRVFLDVQPQIAHFSGHGLGLEGILVANEKGFSELIDTDTLAELFRIFSSHIRCVVLNACYSEVQAQAISRYVDYVIGMKQAIGDRAAIKFSTGFYDALGSGQTIETAFEIGCHAIRLENIPQYLMPILMKKSKCGDT